MAYNIAEIEAYIRKGAIARGMNPDIAVAIAKAEGLKEGLPTGDQGMSGGPWQLYTGQKGGGGLGTEFQAKTGLSPFDRNAWPQQTDFALDKAKQGGWGPWYGRLKAGPGGTEIGKMQGIGNQMPSAGGGEQDPMAMMPRPIQGGISAALPGGGQIRPAGGPTDPSSEDDGIDPAIKKKAQEDPGIFGQMMRKLDYGGVNFRTRLMVLGHALQAFGTGQPTDPNVIGMIGQEEKATEAKQMAMAERAKLAESAKRIHDNLKDSNPALAQAILDNPDLVPEYVKGRMIQANTLEGKAVDQENILEVKGVEQGYTLTNNEIAQRNTVRNKYLEAGLDETAADKAAERDLNKLRVQDVLGDENATITYKRQLKTDLTKRGWDVQDAEDAAQREIDKLKFQDTLGDENKVVDFKEYLKKQYIEHGYSERAADSAARRDTKKLATQHGYTMDEKAFDAANTPEAIAAKEWTREWGKFVDKNDLMGSSTRDVYSKYFKDAGLTDQEAERLANSNRTQEDLREEYRSIIDDRTNKQSATASEMAAKVAGIKLEEGQYIVNANEINADKTGTVKPIVDYAENSKGWVERKAAEQQAADKEILEEDKKEIIVSALDRALASLDRQESGESFTGAGTTGIVGALPLPTEAATLRNELNTIRANLGLDKLQEIRDASKTGGALGPVSDYENRLLQGAIETLTQTEDPQMLRERLLRLKARYADATKSSGKVDPATGKEISVATARAEMLATNPTPEMKGFFDDLYGEGAADAVLKGKSGPAKPSKEKYE